MIHGFCLKERYYCRLLKQHWFLLDDVLKISDRWLIDQKGNRRVRPINVIADK